MLKEHEGDSRNHCLMGHQQLELIEEYLDIVIMIPISSWIYRGEE